MRSCAVALSCCLITLAVPLSAQSQWVPPQAPCDISPGFYRLNSVPVNLKIAAEKPTQRDHLLSQTLDVITRSIREDHQEKNPAAWYYLGRYYVERADPSGADTAFTKSVALAPQCAKDIAGYRNGLYAGLLADGQRTWQEGKLDSAPAFLRLAVRLAPDSRASLAWTWKIRWPKSRMHRT